MKYIFANWKMYLDFSESMIFANQLLNLSHNFDKIRLGIYPSTLAFTEVKKCFSDSPIAVGAQNVAWTPKGAYTGAVSAEMFAQAGAVYALVGHSERRYIFGESDSDVKKKFYACVDAGIVPVLCIGETKEDLINNKREYRVKKQLSILEAIDTSVQFLVAYEPVWAIGTGDACDHIQTASVHDMIKKVLKEYTSEYIPVLYGGSVDTKNVVSYIPHSSIDGFLVGSASTRYDNFLSILNIVQEV